MSTQKILVPVDFSDFSNKALEYAIFWGREFGAEITLLHVNTLMHESLDFEQMVPACEELFERQETHLREWLHEHRGRIHDHGVSLQVEVRRGVSAARVILEFITEGHFDLVVMGTHGRSGLMHLVLGSVTEKVSRLSPVPVLTTHCDIDRFAIQEIVCPVDLSDHSRLLVENALVIARAFQARLHLLYVREQLNIDSMHWLTEEAKGYYRDFDREFDTQIQARLKSFLPDDGDVPVRLEVRTASHAYAEIVAYARAHNADLVVMATRGLNRFEYFWSFGSHTERVVRRAPCPVLAMRWPELERSDVEPMDIGETTQGDRI